MLSGITWLKEYAATRRSLLANGLDGSSKEKLRTSNILKCGLADAPIQRGKYYIILKGSIIVVTAASIRPSITNIYITNVNPAVWYEDVEPQGVKLQGNLGLM